MSTCWIYAAVSSAKQDATIEDQLEWARSVARAQGWAVLREFHGVSSGRDGVRRSLDQLLAELRGSAKSARPARVLMIRIDRLGRGDGLEAIAAISEIRKLGVTIHTREDGDVKIERATDALVPALRSITAALENETRSEKSRAMHARKRATGEVQGLPPFGFIVLDKRLHPYEPEAAFVRDLYEKRARGWAYSKLSAYAREHAPAKRRKDGALQPFRWATTTLTIMLSNRSYRSTIVDADLWDDVYALRKGVGPIAKRGAVHPWPLRGALRCTCGLALSGRVSGAGKYRRRYYLCADAARHHGYPGHSAERIEEQFTAFLGVLSAKPDLLAEYHDRAVDDRDLRARRASLERERESLATRRDRVWALVEDDRIPRDEIAGRLDELRAKDDSLASAIATLDREIARASAARAVRASVADIIAREAATWRSSGIEHQQDIARGVAALVGGLWLDPTRQHELLIGDGEFIRKADDGITKKFIQSISE